MEKNSRKSTFFFIIIIFRKKKKVKKISMCFSLKFIFIWKCGTNTDQSCWYIFFFFLKRFRICSICNFCSASLCFRRKFSGASSRPRRQAIPLRRSIPAFSRSRDSGQYFSEVKNSNCSQPEVSKKKDIFRTKHGQ